MCSICDSRSKYLQTRLLLKKYKVKYYRCTNCHFIETEKPRYWLKSKISAIFFLLFCKKGKKILDYAGGYGIMTRMLRDIGLDCYWEDIYAENIFAKQFVGEANTKYEMITAFEFLEHVDNPKTIIGKIIQKYSPKIFLFSTLIHNGNPPKNWWYFSNDGGQHISLYTRKSLEILATKLNLNYSTNGVNLHLFSKQRIPSSMLILISVFSPVLTVFLPLFYKSKTFSDHLMSK